MTYGIQYSPLAQEDLDRVWDEVYEASSDFDIADKYISDLREAVRQKKKYPKTGTPLTFKGEFTGIYYVHFKEYNIFYVICEGYIRIARVLYARSDYMKSLFGKSEYMLEDTEGKSG